MAQRGQVRIGTSGWVYRHWRGVFYPATLPARQWFAFYARHFDTVEVNNTFYRLPGPETFAGWRDTTCTASPARSGSRARSSICASTGRPRSGTPAATRFPI